MHWGSPEAVLGILLSLFYVHKNLGLIHSLEVREVRHRKAE